MNVNKVNKKNNFSRIRSLPKQKLLEEAMKSLEFQKLNADLGVSIEKTENKAKIEVSMINMNNQLENTAR